MNWRSLIHPTAKLRAQLRTAEAQSEAWQQLYRQRDAELDSIRSARSAHSTRSAATRRAKVMRKAEEMRGVS